MNDTVAINNNGRIEIQSGNTGRNKKAAAVTSKEMISEAIAIDRFLAILALCGGQTIPAKAPSRKLSGKKAASKRVLNFFITSAAAVHQRVRTAIAAGCDTRQAVHGSKCIKALSLERAYPMRRIA